MKHRLRRAPLTDEDSLIRLRVAYRLAPSILGATEYRIQLIQADTRDADLMLKRMAVQAECFAKGYDWRTERRGWFPSDWGCASDKGLNP